MENSKLVTRSLINSLLTAAYVFIVAWVMSHGNQWFGQKDNSFTPVVVLLLFVVSACVVGALVLGKPIMTYLDGQKREAIKLFGFTVMWLAVLLVIGMIVLAGMK